MATATQSPPATPSVSPGPVGGPPASPQTLSRDLQNKRELEESRRAGETREETHEEEGVQETEQKSKQEQSKQLEVRKRSAQDFLREAEKKKEALKHPGGIWYWTRLFFAMLADAVELIPAFIAVITAITGVGPIIVWFISILESVVVVILLSICQFFIARRVKKINEFSQFLVTGVSHASSALKEYTQLAASIAAAKNSEGGAAVMPKSGHAQELMKKFIPGGIAGSIIKRWLWDYITVAVDSFSGLQALPLKTIDVVWQHRKNKKLYDTVMEQYEYFVKIRTAEIVMAAQLQEELAS